MAWPARVHRGEEARRRYGDLPDRLVPWLHESDPLADEVVASLAALPAAARHDAIDAALARPTRPQDQVWGALLEQAVAVPAWTDWDAIHRAGVLFRRAGVFGGLVLGLRSLVYGYAAPAGNKPLALSGRLETAGPHRLAETGRFVHAVSAPGGMRVGAEGWRTTLKVRLMHAQVRRLALRSPRYDVPAWGLPINQHDMLSTILLFSTVFTEGLELLGLRVTAAEKEDYIQLWRLVAHVIGVDATLIPARESEARRFAEVILLTQGPPDEDARALTRALLEGPLRAAKGGDPRAVALAQIHHKIAAGICRVLVGDTLADGLGVTDDAWRWLTPSLRPWVRAVDRLRPRSVLLRALAESLGDAYWDTAVRTGLGGVAPRFELPARLLRAH